MTQPSKHKRIGLALSGGAARGLAHIGVLEVLEREGVPIDCVAGASVGSLAGATYCAGLEVQTIRQIALRVNWRLLAHPVWPRRGLVSFAKLERWLVSLLGDPHFSDLDIPFAAAATDMETGQPVILRQGRLARAVRASCSVPAVVRPVEVDGRLLGDGGVTDNLPVSAVRDMGAERVIGVDLCSPPYPRPGGALGVGVMVIEMLVRRAGGGLDAADCLISPDLSGFSYVRFERREELIALGKKAAEATLPQIWALLEDGRLPR